MVTSLQRVELFTKRTVNQSIVVLTSGKSFKKFATSDILVVVYGLTYDQSTLVYSVKDDNYIVGPKIFQHVSAPVAVPFKNSFILIGGFDYDTFNDTGGTWSLCSIT